MIKTPKNSWDMDFLDDISEKVYRYKLEHPSGGGPGAVKRMLEKDGDGGIKLRGRAASFYGQVTRAYLIALGIEPTKPNDRFDLEAKRYG